jgi:hypothetical protein
MIAPSVSVAAPQDRLAYAKGVRSLARQAGETLRERSTRRSCDRTRFGWTVRFPEQDAFAPVLPSSYDVPITVIGNNQILARTSATKLLAELPELETLAGGRTLSPGFTTTTQQFSTTARLADFLYGVAVQKQQATQFVTDTFNADITWLNTVDQPMLRVAQNWSDIAAIDAVQGKTGQVTLSNVAARIALQIAAQDPAHRTQITEKIQLPGLQTEVTVFPNATDPQGGATFHDIDPGIGGILEALGDAMINVAAVAFPASPLPNVAVAVDLAEAAKAFANGQVISGLLDLAAAAGGFANLLGATQTARIILTASQAVGGVYGAVQSAENGDALGLVAGVLEAAAATASGIGQASSDADMKNLLGQVTSGLNIAGGVLTTAAAFNNGNLAAGMIQSLQAVLTNVANDYNAYHASAAGVTADNINGIYAAELGRAPNLDEFGSAENTLAGGASLNAIRAEVANSPEALNLIAADYAAAYGFTPGAAELLSDAAIVQSSSLPALDNEFSNDVSGTSYNLTFLSQSSDLYNINFDYLTKNEGGLKYPAYTHNEGGVVIGHSGMTIGAGGGGVDIGNQTVAGLRSLVQDYGL